MEIFNTTWKVLIPIFKYPTRGLSIREIARLSGISHPVVIKVIKKLEKEELVVVEKREKVYYVKGNFENKEFIELKRLYNILSLRPLVTFLIENYLPDIIIVFGSYAMGTDFEKSDIDLYVGYKKLEIEGLGKFEKELARKIQVFVGDLSEFSEELKENIINGVKLYGWIKL